MFRRLLAFRVDQFAGMTLAACREAFCRRFDLLSEEPIPGTARTLLFCGRSDIRIAPPLGMPHAKARSRKGGH